MREIEKIESTRATATTFTYSKRDVSLSFTLKEAELKDFAALLVQAFDDVKAEIKNIESKND